MTITWFKTVLCFNVWEKAKYAQLLKNTECDIKRLFGIYRLKNLFNQPVRYKISSVFGGMNLLLFIGMGLVRMHWLNLNKALIF